MKEFRAIKKLFVVPAFNEGENIANVIRDLLTMASPDEILIINDGSTDNTLEVVQSHSVHCIDFTINLGVSAVLLAGFNFALRHGAQMVIQFDGDGQHIADQAEKIAEPIINEECDIAIGARSTEFWSSSSLPRKLGGRLISKVLKFFTGKQFSDPTSGFRAYSLKAISCFSENFPDEYPEVESIILAEKFGLSIKEINVVMGPRLGGHSSITFFGSWYFMVKTLLASIIMTLRKY